MYFDTIEQNSDMMIGRKVQLTKVMSHLNFVNNQNEIEDKLAEEEALHN